MSVLVVVPSFRGHSGMARFCMNLIAFEKSLPRGSFVNIQNVSQGPARCRNVLTHQGLKNKKYEWVLTMDDDELPKHGDVQKLIELDELVSTGLVPRVTRPHHPPIGDFHPIDGNYRNLIDFPLDRPFKVDACGSGFMLLHRDVFDLMDYPWWVKEAHPYLSEDIRFCRELNHEGIRPTVNPEVQVAHMEGRHIFTLKDFIGYRETGAVYRWERDPRYYPR